MEWVFFFVFFGKRLIIHRQLFIKEIRVDQSISNVKLTKAMHMSVGQMPLRSSQTTFCYVNQCRCKEISWYTSI